jgi:hypothetical protein
VARAAQRNTVSRGCHFREDDQPVLLAKPLETPGRLGPQSQLD